ncbi:hypothetical protein [Streptomyces globisporus]|uniref:hypothetical protein n=1 Tax=Streptomyces globisporus TaxID=1908 RepID=UPI0036D0172D
MGCGRSSRIFIWQHFTRLTPSEVLDVIPLFHPIWADADPDDIPFADQHAAHGNFRAWAQLTAHTRTALARTGRPRVDQELLRWAFSRLALPPTQPMPPAPPLSPVTVVIDRHDDVIHTRTALAAHHLPSGRITLHPGPGTTSETGLAHDFLATLGKPPLLTGRFPAGRQPAWEAAAAWMTALPVTRLTVLRAHRLTPRRIMRLLELRALTGIHLPLVCHRPHPPAALHQALRTADYSLTTDLDAARRHYCLERLAGRWAAVGAAALIEGV